LSEAWLIEDFWSTLKGFVYKDGWKAENTDALAKGIKYFSSKVDPKLVQRLAESIHKR
jgi:hypothetical protein